MTLVNEVDPSFWQGGEFDGISIDLLFCDSLHLISFCPLNGCFVTCIKQSTICYLVISNELYLFGL